VSPPLVIDREEVKKLAAALKATLDEVHGEAVLTDTQRSTHA
jgi:adenosylmethionine-8-amino-7-oxononanoate aminotransferase